MALRVVHGGLLGQYDDSAGELTALDRMDSSRAEGFCCILARCFPGCFLRCLYKRPEITPRRDAGGPPYLLYVLAEHLGIVPRRTCRGIESNSHTDGCLSKPPLIKGKLVQVVNVSGSPQHSFGQPRSVESFLRGRAVRSKDRVGPGDTEDRVASLACILAG